MEKFQIKAMSMIRTERLTIYPASREQMETMIASEQEEELKKAYTEMLEAETDAENAASQSVLEKCGFRPNGTFGEEGPRFTLGRPIDAGETG